MLTKIPRMLVAAALNGPHLFAGDKLNAKIEIKPESDETILGGYAAVQGSFRIGEMLLPEPFAELPRKGVVMGHNGIDYGSTANNLHAANGIVRGVLGVLKQLMIEPQETYADEKEYPLFSTNPKLLFSSLEKSKKHVFELELQLPLDLPPTYRSKSLCIQYQLVIGFDRLESQVPTPHRLFLPFRVFSFGPDYRFNLLEPRVAPEPVESNSGENMVAYIDELLDGSLKNRRRASSLVQRYTPTGSKVVFDLTWAGKPIATVKLARAGIRVGDSLNALVCLTRPCLHLTAHLELGESIEEGFAAGSQHTYQTYARQSIATFGLDQVALYLPTLTSIAPRLDTEQVSASWSLRLDFVGLVGTAMVETESGLRAKGQVESESFSCRLPLVVLPPDMGDSTTFKKWEL